MRSKEEFEPNIIREYRHWTLFLNTKQIPYIGRCYAWFKDTPVLNGEGLRLHELPAAAVIELVFRISADVTAGCKALGYQTESRIKFLLNTCYLANETAHNHHMHAHFIPRSECAIYLSDICLRAKDPLWGRNYAYLAPECEQKVSKEQSSYIRDVIAQAINERERGLKL